MKNLSVQISTTKFCQSSWKVFLLKLTIKYKKNIFKIIPKYALQFTIIFLSY